MTDSASSAPGARCAVALALALLGPGPAAAEGCRDLGPARDVRGDLLPRGADRRYGSARWQRGMALPAYPSSPPGVALSPDGRTALVNEPQGGALLVDLETGAPLGCYPAPFQPTHGVLASFTSDGASLVHAGGGGRIEVRPARGGPVRAAANLAPDRMVQALETAGDATVLAALLETVPGPMGSTWRLRDPPDLVLFELGTGVLRPRWRVPVPGARALEFHPDSRLVAVNRNDGGETSVEIRSVVDGDLVLTVPLGTPRVEALSWHPDGSRLLATGDLRIREIELPALPPGGRFLERPAISPPRTWEAKGASRNQEPTRAAFDPTGKWVVANDGSELLFLDAARLPAPPVLSLPGPSPSSRRRAASRGMSRVAFARRAPRLAAVLGDPAPRVVEVPSGRRVDSWRPGRHPSGYPTALALSGDGRRLAVARPGRPPRVTVYDAESADVLFETTGPTPSLMALTRDGTRLAVATGEFDPVVEVLDLGSGTRTRVEGPRRGEDRSGVAGLWFAREGEDVALLSRAGTLWLLDASGEAPAPQVERGRPRVLALANGWRDAVPTRDGRYLGYRVRDREARVVDLVRGEDHAVATGESAVVPAGDPRAGTRLYPRFHGVGLDGDGGTLIFLQGGPAVSPGGPTRFFLHRIAPATRTTRSVTPTGIFTGQVRFRTGAGVVHTETCDRTPRGEECRLWRIDSRTGASMGDATPPWSARTPHALSPDGRWAYTPERGEPVLRWDLDALFGARDPAR